MSTYFFYKIAPLLTCSASAAQGKTWKVVDVPARSDTWLIEPAIATYERDDGGEGVLTLFRSRIGVTLQAYSSDGGHTWGPADFAALPNPNSRVRRRSFEHARLTGGACEVLQMLCLCF